MSHATTRSLSVIHFEIFVKMAVHVLKLPGVQMSDINRCLQTVALVMSATYTDQDDAAWYIFEAFSINVPEHTSPNAIGTLSPRHLISQWQAVLIAGCVHTSNDTYEHDMQHELVNKQSMSSTGVNCCLLKYRGSICPVPSTLFDADIRVAGTCKCE